MGRYAVGLRCCCHGEVRGNAACFRQHRHYDRAAYGAVCYGGASQCPQAEEAFGKVIPAIMKFEDKLKKLEQLVSKMEAGELSLDDMITAFEEGRRLADECQQSLDSIRLRIEKVTKAGEVEEFKA